MSITKKAKINQRVIAPTTSEWIPAPCTVNTGLYVGTIIQDAAGSKFVTGAGTSFSMFFSPGDYLYINATNEAYKIKSVISDTALELVEVPTTNFDGGTGNFSTIKQAEILGLNILFQGGVGQIDGVNWPESIMWGDHIDSNHYGVEPIKVTAPTGVTAYVSELIPA